MAILGSAGCGLDKPAAPDLAGPSAFSLNLSLTATPDTLVQDGSSQAAIQVVAVDANGQPLAGRQVLFSATSSSTLIPSVDFTAVSVGTDASGRAVTHLIAPPPPATVPTQAPVITVTAMLVGSSFAEQVPRSVQVRLIAPEGTLPANSNPVPAFTIVPAVGNINQNITFDASSTTDEGQPCGSRCTYLWDFGDFTTGNGVTVTKSFTLPQSYTVTLTVTDDRGGVASTSRTVSISGPAPPVANFTVTPSSPKAGTAATFSGSTSTVGTGATITQYAWDFGDGGSTVVSTMTAVQKTYAAAGTFLVTLTVTDSLGRQAARSSTVTVAP